MKIIYMGTPDFAVAPLEALVKAGHKIAAVVTQPDKPKGRGKAMQASPVKIKAQEYSIPVFQPPKVKSQEFVDTLRGLKADVVVVAAFGQLLSSEILHMAKYGCFNIHASLLPKYRGAAPMQWAIINGEEKTGITIMQMDEGVDTGDVLLVKEIPLAASETAGSLGDKMSEAGASLIVEALREAEEGTLVPVHQQGESSYAKMLDKSMGEIDWTGRAVEIERLIRGMNPWPSAYTYLQGKMLKLWEAAAEPEAGFEEYQPSEICRVTKKDFSVKAGEGILRIRELQPEGKKRMAADAFMRGYPLAEKMFLKKNDGM